MDAVWQSVAGMPVGTWMFTDFATGAVGSDAADLGGSLSIVRTKAPAASTQATPNIFKARIGFAPTQFADGP